MIFHSIQKRSEPSYNPVSRGSWLQNTSFFANANHLHSLHNPLKREQIAQHLDDHVETDKFYGFQVLFHFRGPIFVYIFLSIIWSTLDFLQPNLFHTYSTFMVPLCLNTLSLRVKQPSISNFFETSQPLRKIKQLTSFWVKK